MSGFQALAPGTISLDLHFVHRSISTLFSPQKEFNKRRKFTGQKPIVLEDLEKAIEALLSPLDRRRVALNFLAFVLFLVVTQ